MSKERRFLMQLLKDWAQEHNKNYVIHSSDPTDEGLQSVGTSLSWVIKNEAIDINLLDLLNKLDKFVEDKINKKSFVDGMYCKICKSFYNYAEPNQTDGTLICFSCRSNPYI